MNAKPAMRVLIAEDDASIRSLLLVICKRFGCDCDSAIDGIDVLAKIRASAYEVILLDLMMPHVSGYQVIEVIRTMPVRPAVIVLTAQPPALTNVLAEDELVTAVLMKPFDFEQLTAILKEIAARYAS